MYTACCVSTFFLGSRLPDLCDISIFNEVLCVPIDGCRRLNFVTLWHYFAGLQEPCKCERLEKWVVSGFR